MAGVTPHELSIAPFVSKVEDKARRSLIQQSGDFLLIPVVEANQLPVKAEFSSTIVEEPIYGIPAEGFNYLLRGGVLLFELSYRIN